MIEGSSKLAGLTVSVVGGELMVFEPGGEGSSELITPETLARLSFITRLAENNCQEVVVIVDDELGEEMRVH